MPKRLSAEQEAQAANACFLKAASKRQKSLKKKLDDMLDERPDLLEPCVDFVSLRMDKVDPSVLPAPKTPAKPKRCERWDEKYNRLEVTPSGLLRKVLQSAGKVAFSDNNIKYLLSSPAAREPPKELLATYVEFISDFPVDKPIPLSCRNLERMCQVVKAATKLNRLANLLLPFDFENEGIYESIDKRSSDEGIWTRRRYDDSPTARRLPIELTGGYKINKNHSVTSAFIAETQGQKTYNLAWLFIDVHGAPSFDMPEGDADDDFDPEGEDVPAVKGNVLFDLDDSDADFDADARVPQQPAPIPQVTQPVAKDVVRKQLFKPAADEHVKPKPSQPGSGSDGNGRLKRVAIPRPSSVAPPAASAYVDMAVPSASSDAGSGGDYGAGQSAAPPAAAGDPSLDVEPLAAGELEQLLERELDEMGLPNLEPPPRKKPCFTSLRQATLRVNRVPF